MEIIMPPNPNPEHQHHRAHRPPPPGSPGPLEQAPPPLTMTTPLPVMQPPHNNNNLVVVDHFNKHGHNGGGPGPLKQMEGGGVGAKQAHHLAPGNVVVVAPAPPQRDDPSAAKLLNHHHHANPHQHHHQQQQHQNQQWPPIYTPPPRQRKSCAQAGTCTANCAAYGKVCPAAALSAGRAARRAVTNLFRGSELFRGSHGRGIGVADEEELLNSSEEEDFVEAFDDGENGGAGGGGKGEGEEEEDCAMTDAEQEDRPVDLLESDDPNNNKTAAAGATTTTTSSSMIVSRRRGPPLGKDVRRFHPSDIVIGKRLGRGGFSVVHEAELSGSRFADHDDDGCNHDDQSGAGAASNHSSGGGGSSSNSNDSGYIPSQGYTTTGVSETHNQEQGHHLVDPNSQHTPAKPARQTYAIKFLRRSVMADRKQFERGAADLALECHLLAALSHPNIIRLHGTTSGSVESNVASGKECGYFLVLDRLYDTLEERIDTWRNVVAKYQRLFYRAAHDPRGGRRRALLVERLRVALQLAEAVRYLHRKNVVYRDLKPDNAGFDARGTVKLFDFGLAKELKPDRALGDGTYKLTGTTGSRRYMAPEVAESRPYNLRVDSYSFGLLLYEVSGLEKPFAGYTAAQHREEVVLDGGRPKIDGASGAQGSWMPELTDLIQRCWSHHMDDRPGFDEIVSTLTELVDGKPQQQLQQLQQQAVDGSASGRRFRPMHHSLPLDASSSSLASSSVSARSLAKGEIVADEPQQQIADASILLVGDDACPSSGDEGAGAGGSHHRRPRGGGSGGERGGGGPMSALGALMAAAAGGGRRSRSTSRGSAADEACGGGRTPPYPSSGSPPQSPPPPQGTGKPPRRSHRSSRWGDGDGGGGGGANRKSQRNAAKGALVA